jgi:hypothetical protein
MNKSGSTMGECLASMGEKCNHYKSEKVIEITPRMKKSEGYGERSI